MALLPDVLDAGTLELRRIAPPLYDGVIEAYESSYEEVHRWLWWSQSDPAPDTLRAMFDEDHDRFGADHGWRYVLVERASDTVVGACGLRRTDAADVVSLGYWVRTDRTRRGYATSASKCLTDAAFTYLDGVDRVQIQMDRANVASAAVPRKLAYRLDRETEYEPLTSGHTGRGYVWVMDRATWRHVDAALGGPRVDDC